MYLTLLQKLPFLYQDKPARVHRAAISPDGARVAAASYFELAVWDVGAEEARWRVVERSNTRTVHTSALAWSADGAHVLAAHDGVLTRYDGASGQVISQRAMPISGVSALVWSPNGARYLAPHRLLYGPYAKLTLRLEGRAAWRTCRSIRSCEPIILRSLLCLRRRDRRRAAAHQRPQVVFAGRVYRRRDAHRGRGREVSVGV